LLALAVIPAAAQPTQEQPVALRLREGQTTLDLRVVGLVRDGANVRFRVVAQGGAVGQERTVPVALVVAPPASEIPVLLRLREGERTLELRATNVVREGDGVRFRPLQASGAPGNPRTVPGTVVQSPPLDDIPYLLRLREGTRTVELQAFELVRDGQQVRFRPQLPSGERGQARSLPFGVVVAPDPRSLPALPVATAGPTTPTAGPTPAPSRAEAVLPPPAEGKPVPPAPSAAATGDVLEDRWDVFERLFDELKLDAKTLKTVRVVKSGKDPYNQNTLKGDKPIIGNSVFGVITATFDTPFEARRLPAVGGVSTETPGSFEFFGRGESFFVTPRVLVQAEIFKGQTAFKPKKWALRITPAFNLNYLEVRERNLVDVDVREGVTRRRQHFSLEEAFAEYEVAELSPYYDSVSVRAGIQPFVSDFRGLVFSDSNLGARLFGNYGNNRWQYNVAYFDLLEKETNSELNINAGLTDSEERRGQKVFIANLFRQDFLTKGYTLQGSFHLSNDEGRVHYDENGFLVRPAPVGVPREHAVRSRYVGLAGDGHIGRLNLSHAAYYAFGTDELNVVSGGEAEIRGKLVALEASIDKDWLRFKASAFWASGDSDPLDEKGSGFDAIYDNSNFAGGPFSFWSRSAIGLLQTKVSLKPPLTLIPSLRSSKFEGQANFVNPGLQLAGVGVDAELTPKLRAILNANYLRFDNTASLETLLFQPGIQKDIGIDYGVGVLYRPLLSENIVVTAGFTGLIPGSGFKTIYRSEPCGVPGCGFSSQKLYNAFVLLRLQY
jgi:hypothetical protein